MDNRLTTAEIKALIMECVKDGETYAVSELKHYISCKTDRLFTPGQISGALMQLTAMEKIQSKGRGLYVIGDNVKEAEMSVRDEMLHISEEHVKFRRQIKECMEETAQKLQKIVNQVDMWEVTDEEFQFLGEIRKLNDQMKKIASKC